MAGDTTARCEVGKLPPRSRGQLRGLPKGENALGVERKGQFTPQALLHLAFGQAKAAGDRIGDLQCDAHGPIASLRGQVGFLQGWVSQADQGVARTNASRTLDVIQRILRKSPCEKINPTAP